MQFFGALPIIVIFWCIFWKGTTVGDFNPLMWIGNTWCEVTHSKHQPGQHLNPRPSPNIRQLSKLIGFSGQDNSITAKCTFRIGNSLWRLVAIQIICSFCFLINNIRVSKGLSLRTSYPCRGPVCCKIMSSSGGINWKRIRDWWINTSLSIARRYKLDEIQSTPSGTLADHVA